MRRAKATIEKGIKRGRDERMIERTGALCSVTVRLLAKDECVLIEQQLLKGRYDCRDGNDDLAEQIYIY